MLKVALADDHQLFRKSLRLMLSTFKGVEVVLEAENGEHLLELMAGTHVDLLLLDIQMPHMDGYQACIKVRKAFPEVKILILSQLTSKESVHKVMECGANGFFSKNTDPAQLENAIRSIRDKDFYFGTDLGTVLRDAILWHKQNQSQYTVMPISKREVEVIRLACQELSSMEIADRLNINVRTVETHRKRIMEKTNSKNFIGVILYALHNKIIQLEEL